MYGFGRKTMKRIRYSIFAGAFAIAFFATGAWAFEFHGYFRDGPGFNSKGGGQVCFQLPGSEFKARLGNECDHYYEFSLSEQVYKDPNGVEAKIEWMPAYGLRTTAPAGGGTYGYGTGNVYTQQIWGAIKMAQLGGASLWAGQRYYRRHNVEGLDWFYWNPYQGNVATGVEDVNLGFGKLALTLGRVDGTAPVVKSTYMVPEVRLYGIAVNPNGTLELGVDLGVATGNKSLQGPDAERISPWFTIEHFQDKFLGGWNKFTVQYAKGAEAAMKNGVLAGASGDPKQWRIVEQFVFLLANQWSGQVALVYQDLSHLLGGAPTTAASPATGAKIFSVEVRPSYHFTDYFKLQLDALYQTMSLKDKTAAVSGSPDMFKLTVAPTLVTGRGFFARPELRLFMTYASWNDAAVQLASAGGSTIASGAFGTDKSGVSYGVQMECWF